MPFPLRQAPAVLALALLPWTAAGCVQIFGTGAAREVSRERLLEISEIGRTNHLHYVGSDATWHYIRDTRPRSDRTYKVRADQMPLASTFKVGDEDSYVLWPWLIEGKPLGTKPQ